MKLSNLVVVAILCGLVYSAPAFAQARGNPAPAKPTDAQRRTALENQLKSGNKEQIDQAYASYKAWFVEDAKVAENMVWYARPLFAVLPDHISQTQELMALARSYKEGNGPPDMAYLNIMEAQILFQQGKDADATAKTPRPQGAGRSSTKIDFPIT